MQLFKPGANVIATLSIYAGAAVPFLALVTGSQISRSSYNTHVDVPINQPVPFSHKHHAWELGIDCRFCHTSVEESSHAGVPSTEVCMTCHSQIWTNSPILQPVRESYELNEPIRWNRVNQAPEFVYFNHAIHVNAGISCNNCHGPVQDMHIAWKGQAFSMAWCLECHFDPGEYLYDDDDPTTDPGDQVFALYEKIMRGEPLSPVEQRLADGESQLVPGDHDPKEMVVRREINVEQLADCYTCHH